MRRRLGQLSARITAAGLGVALTATAVAGCSTSDGNANPDDWGPITLRVPTNAGPDNYQTEALERYADAVEAESDGRITFEFFYQGSLVPPAETVSALHDGLADFAYIFPGFTPADFPVDAWLAPFSSSYFSTEPVVAHLGGTAALMDWSFSQPDMMAEYENLGLVPIVPRFVNHDAYDLLCTSPVTDLESAEGKRTRSGAITWSDELEAVGMVPVSLAFAEVYEGFQRGVVDCVALPGPDQAGLGLWDIGTSYTAANLSGQSSAGLAVSQAKWDSLPLEAQQILWDNATVYLVAFMEGWIGEMDRFVTEGAEKGVEFYLPDPDFQAALNSHQDALRAAATNNAPAAVTDPEAFLGALEESVATWDAVVADELGYSTGAESWEAWVNATGGTVDLTAWAEQIDEILEAHRP